MRSPPRSNHDYSWPAQLGRDPVGLIIESNAGRVPHLIPIRHARMLESPFAFFRGAAVIMAADLASTPSTGLRVQACGDCHLLNFGAFATPERRLIFDVNDFDETLPAPWEWDVKRLATSFVIAGRHNGFTDREARRAALACVRHYRQHMARFASMSALDVWYERVDVSRLMAKAPEKALSKRDWRVLSDASKGVIENDAPELIDNSDVLKIRDNPPLIYHPDHAEASGFVSDLDHAFHAYRLTLPPDRRILLDRYQVVDRAVKVVGVGSVGTRCGVLLLAGPNADSLFLQVKEARPSVLSRYVTEPFPTHHGRRVVDGQRLMQAASDIFLGWVTGNAGRHFYVRQLRDVKVKPRVELYNPKTMTNYAKACGWVLARAHARSGDPTQISHYLGKADHFDQAVASFAGAYADQNGLDYSAMQEAARSGRIGTTK